MGFSNGILRVASVCSFAGAIIIFALGIVGLIFSCYMNCTAKNAAIVEEGVAREDCHLCYAGTIVAIVVGLFVASTELGHHGSLQNTLLRGVLWILFVILPFWGWFSWIGGVLVIIGGLLYILAFASGHTTAGTVSGVQTHTPLLA